jgi:hypothetical protein
MGDGTMEVMAAERKQHPAWEELPRVPEPFESLRELRDRLDTGHHRAEIINGALIVSPVAVFWHERVPVAAAQLPRSLHRQRLVRG